MIQIDLTRAVKNYDCTEREVPVGVGTVVEFRITC
jgi:hypothetical protein